MRFLLTRPISDSEKSAAQLRNQGHEVLLDPLLTIRRLDPGHITFEQYQAIVFTSPNAIRSYDFPDGANSILTFTVGQKTDGVAKEAGFKHTVRGNGNSKNLSQLIQSMIFPKNGPILYLSGVDIAGSIEEDLKAASFQVDTKNVYKAEASDKLNNETTSLLTKGQIDYLPFYSPRSALIFIELIKKANMENCLKNVTALCLSPTIAEVASSTNWKDIQIADTPNQKALYKLVDIELEGMPND